MAVSMGVSMGALILPAGGLLADQHRNSAAETRRGLYGSLPGRQYAVVGVLAGSGRSQNARGWPGRGGRFTRLIQTTLGFAMYATPKRSS